MLAEENKPAGNNEGEEQHEETISELAHRHMQDANHTTSDEELRNAKLEFSEVPGDLEDMVRMADADNTTVIPPIPGEEKLADNDDNKDDEDLPNPYDVLAG